MYRLLVSMLSWLALPARSSAWKDEILALRHEVAVLRHTLLLGRYRAGRLSYVGRTTALSASAGAEVAQFLAMRRVTVSNPIWPSPLPARWVGFDQTEPLIYLPVTPLLVVEVLADTAFEHGRHRHSLRLVRIRPDVA